MPTARLVSRADVPAPNWDLVALRHDQCIVGTAELATLNALVVRMQAENARLRLVLHNSRHDWGREADTRLYRCGTCGLKARDPRSVLMTCEQWRLEQTNGHHRPGPRKDAVRVP